MNRRLLINTVKGKKSKRNPIKIKFTGIVVHVYIKLILVYLYLRRKLYKSIVHNTLILGYL